MVDSASDKGLNAKVSSQPKKFVWTNWTAGGAKLFTKKKTDETYDNEDGTKLQVGRRRCL